MIVKTKNYRLEKKEYIKMALRNILKQQWWVSLIVLAICLLSWLISGSSANMCVKPMMLLSGVRNS